MLDADTKRRIDTARDILVGKVPDPKSQVEQITIALIYKFMDDIDAESGEWGGEREFFAGDFARYGWAKLMHPGLGGHETLMLYAEALNRMPENPGVPALFRDIFSNAYLPYRDPETLREFLKVINEFSYADSERLGDAFEYLLSVLDSQGDAGQFRTPRHIIDFIVGVVDPKKHETVLDPACGTAGFLISSYKHILAASTGDDGQSTLTPDERGRLAENFSGYDISPDMVRLSLVNLYLHGFAAPRIHEYDTLTSEERWNEYADVILANPPFMSPKGGIRPHNRFSVQSKRSEVLFVDYMAEHLTANGRAGIIVPEGIIFQSQNAYKQLRKILVEEHLVAVISLPAGVFNPYSGVKTSILILDRALAKRTATIAFFKVENDGFDLGAQRRPIDRNDLPQAQTELIEYLDHLRVGEIMDDFRPTLGMVVEKERVAADGEYGLSGERYRDSGAKDTSWPIVRLGDLIKLVRGVTYKKNDEVEDGGYQVLRANNIDVRTSSLNLSEVKLVSSNVGFHDDKKLKSGDVFICLASGSKDHIGKVTFISGDTDYYFGGFMGAIRVDQDILQPDYLYWLLREQRFNDFLRIRIIGANINNLSAKILYEYEVPLPPLEVQQEIVAEVEGYQKVIDGARAVVENYRPHMVVDAEWPTVALGEVCKMVRGSSPRPKGSSHYYGGTIPRLMVADITRDGMYSTPKIDYLTEAGAARSRPMNKGDIIVTVSGNPGLPTILAVDACIHDGFVGLRDLNENINREYLYWNLFSQHETHGSQSVGAVFKNLTTHQVKDFKIPLPSPETQQAIATEIGAEQTLVEANRELIRRFEEKIQAAIGRVWSGDVQTPPDIGE